ncbi:MAG TPA: hypothetical protein VGH91_09950 [Gammaproteobacteria bacterium]
MKISTALIFVALVCIPPLTYATNPFSHKTNLWLANGYAGTFGTTEAPTAVSSDGTTAVFGSSYTPLNGSTEEGISVFQKINGSWTEVAFLAVNDFARAVAISGTGDVVAAADGNVIDVFPEPTTGWADAVPSIKLAMPRNASGLFSALSFNTTELLGVFQPSCNSTAGCTEVAMYVEPGAGWATSSSPQAIFSDSVFGPPSLSLFDSSISLSADTIAAVDDSGIGTVTQLAPNWSGGQTVSTNLLPSGISPLCSISGDGFTGSFLAILGYNGSACGPPLKFHVALLQQTSSSWASPSILATLTPSDSPNSNTLEMSASANTVGVVGLNNSAAPCISLYIFQQPVGGWLDANETVKYSGLGYTGDCQFVGGTIAVSDSVIAVQTGDSVEVLDNSTIQPTVDLRATMSLAANTIGAPANQAFQVTIAIENDDSTSSAPAVVLTSAIPSHLSDVTAAATSGKCTIAAGQLNCLFGNFAPGRQVTVTLNATAPAAGDHFIEAADITSSMNVHSLRDTRPALTYSTYTPPTAHDLMVAGVDTGGLAPTQVRGQLSGSDPNGLPITYSMLKAPPQLIVGIDSTGSFSIVADPGVPTGTYQITYVTNNGFVDSVPATVTFKLTANGDQGCNVDCGPSVNPVANKGSIGLIADLILIGLLGLRRLIRRR